MVIALSVTDEPSTRITRNLCIGRAYSEMCTEIYLDRLSEPDIVGLAPPQAGDLHPTQDRALLRGARSGIIGCAH
jgi:hypothetical protein